VFSLLNSSNSDDFITKSEILYSIQAIEGIIQTGIFATEQSNNPFVKPAVVYVLIHLSNLMRKSEEIANRRIDFTDDIDKLNRSKRKIKDVTHLIIDVRNAVCHPESHLHFLDKHIKFTFNILYGKGTLAEIDDIVFKSDYDDDVCFFFGEIKVYLKRHIIRAFQKAKENLRPYL